MRDFLLGLRLDLSGISISSPDQSDLESVLGGIFPKSVLFSPRCLRTGWILPWVDPLRGHSVSRTPFLSNIYFRSREYHGAKWCKQVWSLDPEDITKTRRLQNKTQEKPIQNNNAVVSCGHLFLFKFHPLLIVRAVASTANPSPDPHLISSSNFFQIGTHIRITLHSPLHSVP